MMPIYIEKVFVDWMPAKNVFLRKRRSKNNRNKKRKTKNPIYMMQNESVLKTQKHTHRTRAGHTCTHSQEGKELRDREGKATEINMTNKSISQSGGDRIMTRVLA